MALSTRIVAIIVVLIIIAASGWAVSLTSLGKSTATTTITQGSTTTVTAAHTPYLTPVTSSSKFTIVGFTHVAQFGVWYFGQSQGIFNQYIPNATFTSLSGASVPQALISGQAQMAFGDPSATVAAIAKGAPIQLVANLIVMPTEWQVVVPSNSSYHSLQDLHHAVFSTIAVGSAPYFVLEYILSSALGWKEGIDYTVSSVGGVPAEFAAAETHATNAVVESVFNTYSYTTSGQFRSLYNTTVSYPALSLFASTTFIQQNPNAVRATIEAFLQAGMIWNSNGTAATNLIESEYNLPPAAAAFNYQNTIYSTDGYISLSQTQINVDILHQGGDFNNTLLASSFVNSEFVPVTN